MAIRAPHEAYSARRQRYAESEITIKGVKGDDITFRIQKNNTTAEGREFLKTLKTTKKSIDRGSRWRVDDTHKPSDYKSDILITTKGGSTAAVTPDGDIISVARNPYDTARGADVLKAAVQNGGIKLDSFAGNHEFYARNGFEAVSRTAFDLKYAPKGWNEKRYKDEREDVIFYKYVGVGNVKNKTINDVKANIGYSEDYDAAQEVRDNDLKKRKA